MLPHPRAFLLPISALVVAAIAVAACSSAPDVDDKSAASAATEKNDADDPKPNDDTPRSDGDRDEPGEETMTPPREDDDPRYMQQGTIVTCVDCTHLGEDRETCPTCDGEGSHFQPAQMADHSVQYEIGVRMHERLEILRGDDSSDLPDAIRTALQQSHIYSYSWVAGYRGQEPDSIKEVPDEADEELDEIRRELREEYFELTR